MRHENVLPLLGVSMQQEYRQIEIFNLVLPWLEHGNVREYMYKRSLDKNELDKNEKNILVSKCDPRVNMADDLDLNIASSNCLWSQLHPRTEHYSRKGLGGKFLPLSIDTHSPYKG